MFEALKDLHPVVQALMGTGFTWAVTALGAGSCFLTDDMSRRKLDGSSGSRRGVMIAASFWSLLAPSIEMSRASGNPWLAR